MPAYRFPILVFRDVAGQYTAALVEDDGDIAAYGETAAQAREQLRDHLERVYRGAGVGGRAPELTEAQLTTVRADVRPEYVTRNRVYPCAEAIAVRVPVATGQTDDGVWVAAMPTLGVRFNYFDPADLKLLVAQYVQQRLRGKSPADVARFLPPAEVELQDVVVQVPRELRRRAEALDLSALEAVADPIASRELRGRYGRAWEREEWVETLTQALTRETAPILLLGESGVGKTTILAEAARRLERAGAPMSVGEAAGEVSTGPNRRTHRFWLTSAPRLIAGMQYLGLWQERVAEAIAQAATIAGVLCVENLLDLVRTGGRSAGDSIGAFLVPYLQRGEVRLVSEATAAELDALRRLLPGLADLFRVVTLPSFSRDRAVACLNHVAAAHRQDTKVEFAPGTAETVYRLFARFAPYRPFPGGAVPFVHELFDRATRDRASVVGPAQATTLFSAQTGVLELFLRDEMPLGHDEVVRALDREVIGQPRACRAAAGVVTTFKAGLNDPHRPLGVLLFAGPTGVGKTQLAQSLAGYLYGAGAAAGERRRLVRLDMSEYAGPDAAERFLGSPDGGPAEWIQNVRRQPFTVVLFDEIEKATAEVFDLLLGLFDEGRLTDPWGRLTHFTSAVVVMTTNLGRAGTPGGGTFGLARNAPPPPYDAEVRAFFRPEFLNRIDAVVPFDPLGPEAIRAIAEKELAELALRDGLRKFDVRLAWTPAVVEMLALEGFDALYGARPLQRAIESRVVTALARYLIEQPVARGAALTLDVGADGHVTVRRA